MTDFSAPTPILRSFSEEAARAFYVDFLGFDVLFEHRFDATAPLYLGLRRGACDVHLSEHHGDATPGSAIRIHVDDVDELCAKLNAKAYPKARPGVTQQPWGNREMTVLDPAGNRLTFWTPID
ncbi:MAG: glyoxalase superfamily protein [Pseudomonadota bacterium]